MVENVLNLVLSLKMKVSHGWPPQVHLGGDISCSLT